MSRFLLVCSVVAATAVGAACSSDEDPFVDPGTDASGGGTPDASGGGGTSDGGGGGGTPDGGGGGPLLRCTPIPARVVVMGDSITDCTVIGGPDAPGCISKLFYEY